MQSSLGTITQLHIHTNFNPYPTNKIFVLKISAFYICCIFSNAIQTTFDHGSKHYEP